MVAYRHLLAFNLILGAMNMVQSLEEEVWEVTGVAGRTSDLPCYLNPRTQGDRPKLILWYKKGIRTPIVSSYGGRAPDVHSNSRSENEILTVGTTSAQLTINPVGMESEGTYECRVDFFRSPTHSSFVNLTVIVPPRSVEINDSLRGRDKNGILGPYYEGEKVDVTCLARNGSPLPNVTWWRNDLMIDGQWEQAGSDLVKNNLVINPLTRSWHNQTLTCTASNTHLANPVVATAVVQMYLYPTSVVISNPGPVREGEMAKLMCTSEGSRPPASVKWIVKGIRHSASKEQDYGGQTISTLQMNVTREDHGSVVTCQAQNPNAPNHRLSNKTSLDVYYSPSVTAKLGRSLRAALLKEGDDVYFTCHVQANPAATIIKWYHEGQEQAANTSAGIILSGDSLVLQKVTRRRAGQYRCSATNKLATVTSPPVRLRIRYVPECDTFPTTYFIYDKPINVTCTVASYPSVNSVYWQWNNSNDVITTDLVSTDEEKSSSQLTVNPLPNREDRALSCWAENEMGKQSKPCGFTFKVAQMPLPLSSCRLANITASSLSLTCQRPHVTTAGATTLYRAEVYFDNNTLFANVTSHRPNFNVSKLDAGTSYQIKVYVTHGPVTSQPVVVSAYTSRTSRTSMADSSSVDNGSSVGGVIGGVVVAFLSVLALVLARNFCRNQRRFRRKPEPHPPSDDSNPDVVPNIEETYDLLSTGEGKTEGIVYDVMDPSMGEDVAMQSMSEQQESYHPLMLQHSPKEVEDCLGVRSDLYCPVDQLMKAEESVV